MTFTAGTFTTAQGGSVTISSNGNFTYTPKPEFVGSDSFTFSAIDDGDTSAPATVSITVKDAAPSVTTPIITGTAIEGQTLTASANGGNDAVTYQWYSSVDNYQTPIGSGSTYQLQETDEGNRIKVIATVTDENGATISATSSRTASVADISPTLSVTVAGAAQEGQTLTATAVGNESDAPVTYQWQFSNNGTTWTNISGATSATYLVSEARENQFLRVTAKSADPDGSTATATSAATSAVLDAVPTVTTPTISGTAQEGRTLTASASAGQSDNPVTYQWFSSADGYHTAIGSGSTYAVSEGNEGYTIEVVATATNGNGVTISQTSLATASVLDAAPTVTKPIIAGTAQVGQTLTASASAGQTDNAVTYQWFSSADGYHTAIGSGSSYTINDGNEGYKIEVVATATNGDGLRTSATSAPTALVTEVEAAPALTAPSSLNLPKGGTVALGISVAGIDSDDTVSVRIAGIAGYEYLTNGLDSNRSTGASVTFTEAEVSSGLTLHSTYTGNGKPVNNLSVTATNSTAGESITSASKTITVTDPPASTPTASDNGDVQSIALLRQYMASSFVIPGNGHGGLLITDPPPSLQPLLAQPHA